MVQMNNGFCSRRLLLNTVFLFLHWAHIKPRGLERLIKHFVGVEISEQIAGLLSIQIEKSRERLLAFKIACIDLETKNVTVQLWNRIEKPFDLRPTEAGREILNVQTILRGLMTLRRLVSSRTDFLAIDLRPI